MQLNPTFGQTLIRPAWPLHAGVVLPYWGERARRHGDAGQVPAWN